jgi:hypothetical protein
MCHRVFLINGSTARRFSLQTAVSQFNGNSKRPIPLSGFLRLGDNMTSASPARSMPAAALLLATTGVWCFAAQPMIGLIAVMLRAEFLPQRQSKEDRAKERGTPRASGGVEAPAADGQKTSVDLPFSDQPRALQQQHDPTRTRTGHCRTGRGLAQRVMRHDSRLFSAGLDVVGCSVRG